MSPRRPVPPPARARRGFTVLELLIALGIAAATLLALNTLVFSMGELWGRNTDLRLFEQHARAVTRYLEKELRAASLPPAAIAGATPVAPQEVRVASGATDNLLTFELPAGTRLIPWPDRPLPEVVCSLQADERSGLRLLWHSRLEKRFNEEPPHETTITPLVTALSYDYYDDQFKNWKNETMLRRDSSNKIQAPQRLRLKFAYGKLTREMFVVLPTTPEALPNF